MDPIKPIINLPNSSSGQENTLDLVDFDRISALPDSILGVILSYLPTKNAVATTILSKRWEFVWMIVHNLDFRCPYRRGNDEIEKFLQFVNRVLLLHDGGLLNKFRLVWKIKFIPSQVSSWITTAITRNVHGLILCVGTPWHPFKLPITLFSCDSLQSLELNGGISVSAAIVVSLPRLESLKLVYVYFRSEESFQKLISGCPMLKYTRVDLGIEELSRHLGEENNFTYRISSPSLRRLDLCNHLRDSNFPCSLELEASSLEYLKIDGHIPQVFVHGSLSSLVEADFRIILQEYDEDIYNSLAKGVRYFDCAKALTLSPHVMRALSNATVSLSTKFSRLTKLKAEVVCCYCSSLLDFIQSSDSLQVLSIYKQTYDLVKYDHDHSNWTAPVEVPKCLSNSLKEVSLEGYSGCDDEREMIGYLLKHGSVLEVMKFSCPKYKFKDEQIIELVKEICRFPRKSPACKLEYIE